MILDVNSISELKKLLDVPQRIVVVSHTNPDGDAIGSGLALTGILEQMGHEVRFIVPNNYPVFLEWMSFIDKVNIYKECGEVLNPYIADADVIFCVDFNQTGRLEGLSAAIEANTSAVRVVIDHHLSPPPAFDIMISETSASSTSYLIYKVAEALGVEGLITYPVAEALYVGISTDTGNFTFGNLTPDLFCCVARLVELGVEAHRLNIAIYNNYSVDRMRLMGYMLHEKMIVVDGFDVAYMTLSRDEQVRFRHVPGDTEGFVNLPLSVREISMSAFFMETRECIKVSLRSQGDIDVNLFARKYFNGGGHRNAAGGKHFGSMDEAVGIFISGLRTNHSGE